MKRYRPVHTFLGQRVKKEALREFTTRTESHERRKAEIQKKFVLVALAFIVIGIVLRTFPAQESHTEENLLDKWDHPWSLTVIPQYSQPILGVEMQEGSFFELNVTTSDTLRMRLGTFAIDNVTGEEVPTNLIFDQVGTHFHQRVEVNQSGIYQVEIENEGTNSVSVWGNVLAKKLANLRQTVYPYSPLGTLVALGGFISLIYGVLTKPKKRRARSKVPTA